MTYIVRLQNWQNTLLECHSARLCSVLDVVFALLSRLGELELLMEEAVRCHELDVLLLQQKVRIAELLRYLFNMADSLLDIKFQ